MAKLPQSASLIDLDALHPEVAVEVRRAMEYAISRLSRDEWMRHVCISGTDAELIAAGEKEYPGAPIGVSSWYDCVRLEQDTIFNRVSYNNDRRPVFMRGGKQVLIRRHCLSNTGSSPNGWAVRVFWRCVRIAKITSLNNDEFRAATRHIYERLCKKYYLTTPFDRNVGWDVYGSATLVGGKKAYLNDYQITHIKALKRIASRVETLEKKRELVKAALLERLAA